MANKEELTPKSEKNLSLDKYGLETLSWDRARTLIETHWIDQEPGRADCPHTHFISTVRPDGSPHVAPVGAAYHEGAFYIVSGAGTRKSQNLAGNPKCAISLAPKGMDLAVEGEAKIVRDEAKLNRLAQVFSSWGPKVENGAFVHEYSAPSAGPPPWDVYEISIKRVIGVATAEPYGATRWNF